MKVKLKVLKGSGAGKEIRIPTPKCLIGRSDECHMRPKSEAVSRRHCVLYVKDGKVVPTGKVPLRSVESPPLNAPAKWALYSIWRLDKIF